MKHEREKRKISLEQISSSTKIGTRMLQALEEDRFNLLPGGIFNKGFVRSYARFVGLDEDQVVADYMKASGDEPPPRTEIAAREDEARDNQENLRRMEASASRNGQIPWGLLAGVLLLLALALALRARRQREVTRHPAAAPVSAAPPPGDAMPSPPASANASSSSAAPASAAATSAGTTKAAPPNLESSGPTSPSTSAVRVTAAAPGPAASAPSQPLPASAGAFAPSATAAPGGEFTVVIRAREASWISVTVDGKSHSTQNLRRGDELAFHGHRQVVAKVGNAGGVEFLVDGKKIDTGGEPGEVKTVVFTAKGSNAKSPSPGSATPLGR